MPLSRSALDAYLKPRMGEQSGPAAYAAGDDPAPLCFGQEQIWLHGQAAPELPLYNETIQLGYRGTLNLGALTEALQSLVERHQSLRLSILVVDGEPRQQVHAPRPIPCRSVNLSGLAPQLAEAEAARLAQESAGQLFDLAQAPLLRVLAVQLAAEESRLYFTLHHLIFDGASLRSVFLPELIALYRAYSDGQPPPLSEPPLQLPAAAAWQRQTPFSGERNALDFWRSRLSNLPTPALPTDQGNPSKQGSLAGAAAPFRLSPVLTESLRILARRENATIFQVLTAGLAALLSRCSGETDIPVATMFSDRTHPDLENVLGCLLNTILLRMDLSGDPSFSALLARAGETSLSALSHAVPFQKVVRELGLSRTGYQPRVVVGMQPPMPHLPPGWSLDTFAVTSGTAKFDLHFEWEERENEIVGRLQYRTELFEAATIERLLGYWSTLLEAAAAAPQTPVTDLPLLGREELERQIDGFNQTAQSYPELPMPALFQQQAALAPDRIAIRFRPTPDSAETALTYRELDMQSTSVAHALRDEGAGPGSRVAILLERSPELLVALLGVLKSGAAYVPLDPAYPAARLQTMLRAADACLLLTRQHLAARVSALYPPVLDIGQVPERRGKLPTPALGSPAYLLFTSGSTGEPKGVLIPHRALTNLLCSMRREPGFNADDTLLALTGISFDIAALELFLPLVAGACIELATSAEAADPLLLQARLANSGATVMQATPATWRMLLESGWNGNLKLKALCGGEALSENLARDLLPRVGSLWNLYGPTETTIWSSCAAVGNGPISLGKPIANTELHVLDARGSLLPVGCSGELAIGGDGLAIGYWNRPEETARRFTVAARDFDPPRRLYRTGDRVLRRADGTLTFLGRTDRQVKLRGFRIELGEIEQAMRLFPAVADSAVLKIGGEDSTRDFLAAYAVPRPGSTLDVDELRRFLDERLPVFLRPASITLLDHFPLTLNGKVDRKQLPSPVLSIPALSKGSDRPRTRIEKQLAALWSEILSVPQVGREDDFFDLGGHSLLAARLLARVTALFGRRLPLSALVEAPTIAQLAVLLETGAEASGVARLRRSGKPGKHMIWLGGAPWLRELGKLLGEDHSLSSIVFSPETLAGFPGTYRLEELARRMAARVRELEPEGPYLLGGFCLEGLLAYEVAQQMRAAGDEVALLVMGDVVAPGRADKNWAWHIERRVRQELPFLRRLASTPPWKAGPLLRWRRHAFSDNEERAWRRWGRTGSAPPHAPETMLQALYMAESHYSPRPYDGCVLFLEAKGGIQEPRWYTASTWKGLIADAETFVYPGDHLDFLEEPILSLGSARLREAIDRAAEQACLPDRKVRRTASGTRENFSVQPLETGRPITQP